MTDLTRHLPLKQRIKQAWFKRRFLKKHVKNCLHPQLAQLFFGSLLNTHRVVQETRLKQRPLSTLPLCLIIGAAHSGKSSLLDNSGLTLYPVEGLNSHYQPMAARGMPQFHVSQHKVFVELPTYLFINESVKHVPYLQQLLDFFSYFGYLEKTREIIYTVSLDDLLQNNEAQRKQLDEFFASLTLLVSKISKPIFVHLAITKIDRLLGFNEFFDDLSFEERQLACGIVLTHTTVQETFQKQFHHLVRRLTERLFWRCHSEHQLHRRLLVADFPQQFLQQESLLYPYLARLADMQETTPQLRIKSMYWVSHVQQGQLIDLLRHQHVELMHTPVAHCLPLLLQRKAFFVRGFFQHLSANLLDRHKLRSKVASSKKPRRKVSFPKITLSKKWWALALIPVLIVLSYGFYIHQLSKLPLASLQQDPALAYTLISANNPHQALQAYIAHVAPQLSLARQQDLSQDPVLQKTLLDLAINYVNQAWQEKVVSFYNENLKAHYPIDSSAKPEVDLKKFTAFYGPTGLLHQFDTEYAEFLKTHHLHENTATQQLLTASQTLHKNLFNATSELALNFSLSPNDVSTNLRQLTLTLAGTSLIVKAHTITNKNFVWPNTLGLNQSGYVLQKRDAPLPTGASYPGVWSWLKLMQQGHFSDISHDEQGNFEANLILMEDGVQFSITSHQDIHALLLAFHQLTVPTTFL